MIRQNHPDLKSVLVLLSTANLKSIGYVECYDLRSFISFHLITYDTDNCEYNTLNYSENHIHTETLNSHFYCNMSNVLLYCKFYEFVICCDSLTVSYSFFFLNVRLTTLHDIRCLLEILECIYCE